MFQMDTVLEELPQVLTGEALSEATSLTRVPQYVASVCTIWKYVIDCLTCFFLSGARFLKHLHKIYEMPGWLIFCRGGCPLHFGVFSSTPDLCALDTNSSFPTPSWNKWKCPRHYQVSPGGQKSFLVEYQSPRRKKKMTDSNKYIQVMEKCFEILAQKILVFPIYFTVKWMVGMLVSAAWPTKSIINSNCCHS